MTDGRTVPRDRGRFLVMRLAPRLGWARAQYVNVAARVKTLDVALDLARALRRRNFPVWVALRGNPCTVRASSRAVSR